MMKRSVVFAAPELKPLVELAPLFEAAGFDRIWTTENPGRDAMIRALAVGHVTESIGVATGITYAFTRAPLAAAAAAADINELLNGRFQLGLGAGTQGMRKHWYDVNDFDRPATRLAEYARLMRESWRSEKALNFSGEFYSASYADVDWPREEVPIWGSGINPTMLKIAAREFEGVALHPLGSNLEYLAKVVMPAIDEGVGTGARPQLALWRVTSIDADEEVAIKRARKALAFYFSTPSYGTVADVAGYGAIAEAIRDGYRDRGPMWHEHAALVSDEMVAAFCLAGTPEQVSARWNQLEPAFEAAGASEVVFQTVTGDKGSGEAPHNLQAIAHALSPTWAV